MRYENAGLLAPIPRPQKITMGVHLHKANQNWTGVAQGRRMKGALHPDYVKVDEREVSDLMAFLVDFARHIRFYNQENQIGGDWSHFFQNDLSFFLAKIMATDRNELEEEKLRILSNINSTIELKVKKKNIKALFQYSLNLAKRIDQWYKVSLRFKSLVVSAQSRIEETLSHLIYKKLSRVLNQLKAYDEGANKGVYLEGGMLIWERPIGGDYTGFHPIWRLEDAEPVNIFTEGRNEIEAILLGMKKIRLLTKELFQGLTFVIEQAEVFLQENLSKKSDHEPGAALLITFLELFGHATQKLNGLTKRHLDYYYERILRQRPLQANPDKVYVFFDINPTQTKHFLPANTLLLAGRDEADVDNLYRTDHDLTVSKTQIQELKTVFLERNPNMDIGSSYQLVTNVYAAPIANSRNGVGEDFLQDEESWPMFGQHQYHKRQQDKNMVYAALGFAIATPILALSEGERNVALIFKVEDQSSDSLARLIRDISLNENLTPEDTTSKVLNDSFCIEVSTPEGWFELPAYSFSIPQNGDFSKLSLRFKLLGIDPPFSNYDAEVLGEEFSTTLPVLKVKLRSEAPIYAYSFLRDLILESVDIHVDVKGVKNLDIFNDFGPIESNSPFQPFDAAPKIGSYVLFGKSELFRKRMTDMSVHIDWHNLPDLEGGFETYYDGYLEEIRNEDFKVSLSALSGNKFLPTKKQERQEFQLFETEGEERKLKESIHLENIQIPNLEIYPDFFLKDGQGYDNNTRTGFFKLELTSPRMGFGHDRYTKVLAKASLFNAQPQKGFLRTEKEMMKVPELPYAPTIRRISLDYKASASINLLPIQSQSDDAISPDEFYHIEPFGISKIFDKHATLERNLIPQFEHHGYLLIGLKDLYPPTELSFLFKMEENRTIDTFYERPEIVWWYLEEGRWVSISAENILLDSTDDLTGTGLVLLKIPRTISKGNNLLNSDLHWLRVTIKGDHQGIPPIKFIHPNAVSATWVDNGHERQANQVLQAHSIEGLFKARREIHEVHQPYPSFGGRKKETEMQFYTRVSERLRHKNRAINVWDYERLVLEHFPNIFQIKCIPSRGNEKFVAPGTLVAVVVPALHHDGEVLAPKATYDILQEVKEFLTQYASPFASIEVRNPTYENLKISCGVIFERGKNNGSYIKRLNQDLLAYICPWTRQAKTKLNIGGELSKNVVLNFIRNRPYVKFVTRFSMVQVFDNEEGKTYYDTATDVSHSPFVKASTPWSVLVPMKAQSIELLDENSYKAPEPAAVNTMILGTDFILGKSEALKLKEENGKEEKSNPSRKKMFFLKVKRHSKSK